MSITKAELTACLCEQLGFSRTNAKDLVENFFEEICLALEQGEEIKLSGFGNFELRDKESRPGRNPKTGKDVLITARRVVTFKQGQKLKGIMAAVTIDPQELEKDE